ncbi:hypothetical protein MLD38_022101 [Melastoma candidum]|uniref:Uncharacterized protein n=1 Tax=Melastoma candidum TaxID=119954 RepID=A0ACB9QI33_9MYRT|nr:hypothetical protein MLD38_022101 [Melastoma candidum]
MAMGGSAAISVELCFMVVVLAFLVVEAELGSALMTKDYISWDDMRVSNPRRERTNLRQVPSKVIVVDGSGYGGDSFTVQGAIDMVPEGNSDRVKIVIRPGTYREKVHIPFTKPYISLIGDENHGSDTIITWNDKASDRSSDGSELGTYRSASVTVESDYFCATGITIQNKVVAVPGWSGMQAVALRINGDKAVLYRVRVLGTQDTLLDEAGSHYFLQCLIQGSVDFIFGRSRSLYEECVIHSIADQFGAIAAHHRDSPDEDTGFSFVNCIVNGTGSVYLGRAWGDYSRVVYSYSYLDRVINPRGWSDWNHPYRQRTVVFGEYRCRGAGANMRGRVTWSKSLSSMEAGQFLDRSFIGGETWLRL